ncbi:YeeE/YedE family protein [Acinetobacter sp. MD2(2019)]|uniref:YeeE/YedE family protein n=1 Tax=Acinetobacter sp. MD2(2019) TaxID=2605273 RepID=UPI002D1EBD1F|nr:YeeE/YedE thiosulfate transporter family protein [Acinetobacter sp. MD2(2019)]MEB3754136.1 YeeE/YedE family protein [Acinetobacter sp. MD2(2019)]
MPNFSVAVVGGALIGLATVGYLYVNGRIAGISGLIAERLQFKLIFSGSGFWFLCGLLFVSFIYGRFTQPAIVIQDSPLILMIAGLLVGFGTRLGSGCTSGHGICGISRLSFRSIFATILFIMTGMLTVYVIRHVMGAMQ